MTYSSSLRPFISGNHLISISTISDLPLFCLTTMVVGEHKFTVYFIFRVIFLECFKFDWSFSQIYFWNFDCSFFKDLFLKVWLNKSDVEGFRKLISVICARPLWEKLHFQFLHQTLDNVCWHVKSFKRIKRRPSIRVISRLRELSATWRYNAKSLLPSSDLFQQ